MPKISALPPMTSTDGDDESPIVDDSVGTTKKLTLTQLKEWLQSLSAWISLDNLNFDSGIWGEEIGRTTLSGASDTVTVDNLPARKYLTIIISTIPTGQIDLNMRFNNDSGNNYTTKNTQDGTPSNSTSDPNFLFFSNQSNQIFSVLHVSNIANRNKIVNGQSISQEAAGAATAPIIRVNSGKWANTSVQISRVDLTNPDTGDFAAGTEVIVLGHN